MNNKNDDINPQKEDSINTKSYQIHPEHVIPLVSIITVGMNHLQLLEPYLYSLFKNQKPVVSFELIYVDNCSSDGSVEFVKSNYPNVLIIENKICKGFSENNNLGVKHSKGNYILILNPDILVLSNSIDSLYSYFIKNLSAGILVPKLLNPDRSIQFSVRNFFSLKIIFNRLLNNGEDDLNSKIIREYLLVDFDANKTQEVNWAMGAAMFLSRAWYDILGGFDEGYYLYVEDADICLKSWKLGRPVIYFPESVFIHCHLRSSSKNWNKKILHIKSMVRFFFKHNVFMKSYDYSIKKTIS